MIFRSFVSFTSGTSGVSGMLIFSSGTAKTGNSGALLMLSLIHISEPTRL